jgi:hypothetical protein
MSEFLCFFFGLGIGALVASLAIYSIAILLEVRRS